MKKTEVRDLIKLCFENEASLKKYKMGILIPYQTNCYNVANLLLPKNRELTLVSPSPDDARLLSFYKNQEKSFQKGEACFGIHTVGSTVVANGLNKISVLRFLLANG